MIRGFLETYSYIWILEMKWTEEETVKIYFLKIILNHQFTEVPDVMSNLHPELFVKIKPKIVRNLMEKGRLDNDHQLQKLEIECRDVRIMYCTIKNMNA